MLFERADVVLLVISTVVFEETLWPFPPYNLRTLAHEGSSHGSFSWSFLITPSIRKVAITHRG